MNLQPIFYSCTNARIDSNRSIKLYWIRWVPVYHDHWFLRIIIEKRKIGEKRQSGMVAVERIPFLGS